MSRHIFWIGSIMLCLVVSTGVVRTAHRLRSALAASAPGLDDLAWVTAGPHDAPTGCAPIGVLRIDADEPVHGARDIRPNSPLSLRLAATRELDLVLAIGVVPIPVPLGGWGLYGMRRNGPEWSERSTPITVTITGARPCGGIAVMPDDDTLLLGECSLSPTPAYAVRRYRLSDMNAIVGGWELGQATAELALRSLPAEVVAAADGDHAHVVTEDMSVMTIDVRTMSQALPPIAMAPLVLPFRTQAADRERYVDAALSPDERYLVTGRGYTDQINVADLVDRRSSSVSAGADVTMTFGVAFDRSWRNSGYLAIHGCSQVLVDALAPDGTLQEVGRAPLRGLFGCLSYLGSRLAWSGDGSSVVAAYSDRNTSTGWTVLSVEHGTGRVDRLRNIGHCPLNAPPVPIVPNDVLTANGHVPTPTTVASTTPSPTASATPSPTSSPTPTATPTSTATVTRPAERIYLPLTLREHCVPGNQRVDVAMVIDGSTSMRDDRTATGRPKLAAAIEAASAFVGMMALPQDQVAVVIFNDGAEVLQSLTERQGDVDAALVRIPLHVRRQTRIDLGIEKAHEELTSARRKPANQPVVILLTDGLANPEPASTAVRRAQAAKDDHITIFTIGLGRDDQLNVLELQAMASQPEYFYLAPDGEDLFAIYSAIAVEIPCPAKAFWGRR